VRPRSLFIALTLASSLLLALPASGGTIDANVVDGVLTVNGTSGDDGITLACQAGNVTVNDADPSGGSTACSDLVRIRVFAGDGSDHVSLADVSRSAFGGLEDVSAEGEDGQDTLIGSRLGDMLNGGGGFDTLRGGDGKDRFDPGGGPGEIVGGHGKDTVSSAGDGNWFLNNSVLGNKNVADNTIRSIERVRITGGDGGGFISAGTFTGALTVDARGGNDLVASGNGNDKLFGGDGNDFLQSGDGNDVLEGGLGDDVLRGDNGNDRLDGGPGNDTCTSGAGADVAISC
jgi:Ca2+-binding RTX toxin-like protein